MKYNNISYYVTFLTEKTSESINMPNVMLILFSITRLRFILLSVSY